MYVYPNGLKCNVSKRRVDAYECLVVPILGILMLAGFVSGLIWGSSIPSDFWSSIVVGLLASLVIPGICVGLGAVIFRYWCKPQW